MRTNEILLSHGSGGKMTRELIESLFGKYFANPALDKRTDSAVLTLPSSKIAFTTDSYVVDPLFFPGGNIGTLAVCGTVNDLAVAGAEPLYLSTGFIIEEGFSLARLEEIVGSMADKAKSAGVSIVTGDTKVVERGKCDGVFITTAGVGRLRDGCENIGTGLGIQVGDKVIVSGAIGDHGMAIMALRNTINLSAPIESDCAPLNAMVGHVLDTCDNVRFMRDATRGGLTAVLCELIEGKSYGVTVDESRIPVHPPVSGLCEMIGFDVMHVANEGKIVLVVAADQAEQVVESLKADAHGTEAAIIGEIVGANAGRATVRTQIGGHRILDLPSGEQLPRIC